MKKVIFGIGIVGAGKTTTLKKIAGKYGYEYICPDDIREELTGNAADQSRNEEVWTIACDRMRISLSNKDTNVVFDATQTIPMVRRDFIKRARDYGAEKIQALLFSVPFETASERNMSRDRVVPQEVVEGMYAQLMETPPSINEGIDSIFKIDSEGIIIGMDTVGWSSPERK